MLDSKELRKVYKLLQERKIHPQGEFDNAGRFYLTDGDLVDVRTPSRAYPYSQMQAGRSLKFVKAINEKYKPKNLDELLTYFVER